MAAPQSGLWQIEEKAEGVMVTIIPDDHEDNDDLPALVEAADVEVLGLIDQTECA